MAKSRRYLLYHCRGYAVWLLIPPTWVTCLVFIPFHWVFRGKEGKEEKKREEKGRNCGKSSTFYFPSQIHPELLCNSYLHQCAQACIAILTINSRSTCNCCSAPLPIVHTSTSTYLSTFLAKHSTYFWAAQNIIIAWAAQAGACIFK